MSFLKKLFSKKKERKVKHGKDKHLLEFIQQYKSMDEGKKTKLNKQVEAQFFAERELINSAITRARNEVQKGELEAQTARAGRARKIVNEYGRALQDATREMGSSLLLTHGNGVKSTIDPWKIKCYILQHVTST